MQISPRSLVFGRLSLLVPLGAALLLVACGSGDDGAGGEGGSGGEGGLHVVTTTPILAEFAEHVAGDEADVESLIPPGVDLHSWQPSTSVARTVAGADVLIVNGYNLEESLLSIVFENASDDAEIVVAAAGLEALAGGHEHEGEEHADEEHEGEEHEDEHAEEAHSEEEHAGEAGDLARAEGDPHLWLSVPNAIHYVENIRDALVEADAEHAAGYEERAGAYIEELETLDGEVRETLTSIPEGQRTIVAFHDAYQYLAHEYGLEVVASVAPANPNQETSAQAIAEIVAEVRELGVRAVYKEPEFSGQSLDLIARETGTEVLTLYGTVTDDVPTYAEMMRANAESLVEGLAG